jgi:MoaA/NifB/PqqE/SkfB family radical SAM enzyme
VVVMNSIASFLHHLCLANSDRWYPMLSVYYLTYACRFRCPHCSDGSGEPYYRLRSATLPASKVIDLLRIVRRHSDFLVITGGEPLEHPEVAQVLNELPSLKFRGVVLTTNGYAIDRVLDAVARSVHYLVFSLQTLGTEAGDAGYGVGRGVHRQVLANIERAASYPGRRFEIIISSVVTPGNIPDLYEVYGFSQRRGFRHAACPQLVGVKAHPALAGNSEYSRFFDFLITEKKRGGSIQGTVDYLEYMRDLRKFSCRPFTMLVVSPTGEVFYPCLEQGQSAGNLFQEPDLHRLRQAGFERYGPQPDCDNRCHSACALGFARLLSNPASLLHEAALMAHSTARSFLSRAPGGSFENSQRGGKSEELSETNFWH